jgi:drug/metabolite transporter (DMT)-like permease
MLASALLALPLALASFPADAPGAGPVAAIAALGAGGTGIAFVIFYTLIADVGPAKASIVAYIAPVFAVIYGVTFRDEAFTLATLAGMALILGGSWIAGQGELPGRARRERVRRSESADGPPRPANPPVPAGGA